MYQLFFYREGRRTSPEMNTVAKGMSDADLAVVVTLLNTSTVKQAAAALRVTDRTVRNRRESVVRQLRALADVA